MILEPGDANCEIIVTETFHLLTDDELSDKELKQIEADDQDIQTILLGLPEDIYAAVDTPYQDQSSFNPNYLQQPMPNPKDITDPITAMNMALTLMAKAFKLNYSTPTNNNQRISSNPRNRKIAQPGMNMGQDRQIQMVRGNGGNQFRVQNVGNQNGLISVQGSRNQNQIGNGHYARNCTVRPRRRDVAYLQTQLFIVQKEEAGIQLQTEKRISLADASLAKHKALELEIERLLKAVVSQDIKIINTSKNTKFAKQPIVENLPNAGETHALSKPVTSNSISTPQESKGVNNDKVIAPGMFRINPSKTFREEKHVPNTVSASNRTKPITVSQPFVITKKDVNSDLNGLSSTGKFMGTVRFGNDHVAAILEFGDLQNACFVRNLEGVDLLKGDRSTNLYTINLHEMASATPICLMARASSTKSWLWH
nr:hypothetical protein [Tanacetum cinerariifolium]